MQLRKFLTISIILVMGITPILPNLSATQINTNTTNTLEIPESHIIENVPYMGQNGSIGCNYCSYSMVFQYYNVDVTPGEIAYCTGVASSCAGGRKLISGNSRIIKFPPFKGGLCAGNIICEGQDDFRFLGQIYGFAVEDWVPENRLNKIKCWNEYWTKLKSYISEDVPILTVINPVFWPIFQKAMNWSKPPVIGLAAHCIVIVGYNETNNSVCYHDPMATLYPLLEPGEGEYGWVDLDTFKKCVSTAFWELWDNSYEITAYQKVSDPLPKDTIFRMASAKNLERIKGNQDVYDKSLVKNFKFFGIEAIKCLKKELFNIQKPIFFTYYCFKEKILSIIHQKVNFPYYHNLQIASQFQYSRKDYISDVLNSYNELIPEIEHEARLLKYEAKCWEEIYNLSVEFEEILINNPLIESKTQLRSMINQIIILLESVVTIEQGIINIYET